MRALVVLGLVGLAACAHGPETEVGRPKHAFAGRTLVVVPRACITDHAEDVHPGEHVVPRTAPETQPPPTTARIQAMLDGVGPSRPYLLGTLGPRPHHACEVPIDTDLDDVRATDETVQAMHAQGAEYAVVLEVHTELGCSVSQPWSSRDACSEDEVTIAAWMFDAHGDAIWSLTRRVNPTDEVTAAVDRVLARVPTAERLRRTRAEYEVAGFSR